MTSDRLKKLQKFMKEEPDDPFLKYAFAVELIALEKIDEACERLAEIMAVHPDYLPTYYLAAKYAYQQGKTDEAGATVRKGMELAERKGNRHALGELRGLMEEYDAD